MDKLIQHEMQYINMIYIIHMNSLIFIKFLFKVAWLPLQDFPVYVVRKETGNVEIVDCCACHGSFQRLHNYFENTRKTSTSYNF